jgi:hypothetical protein
MDRGPSPALQGRKINPPKTPSSFDNVSYGLAVSMLEEDRLEVAQSLRMSGYDAEVLAKGEQLHRAAAEVMMSRFSEGLDELERLGFGTRVRNAEHGKISGGNAPFLVDDLRELVHISRCFALSNCRQPLRWPLWLIFEENALEQRQLTPPSGARR